MAAGVRAVEEFDESRLAEYLRSNLENFGDSLVIEQIIGGRSNPTFILSTSSQRYVLRKQPPGELLPSAHLVDREYRIMKALASTVVPVPKVRLLCQDKSVIGTDFFIMDFVEGSVFRDNKLPGMAPGDRTRVYHSMADALADLHAVDCAVAGLSDFGKPTDYLARQAGRWSKQYVSSQTDDIPAMDRLVEWLPNNIPADESTTIAHGDFRLENMIVRQPGAEVAAILDWELSTLGHPLADLAYNCMPYHLPAYMKPLGGFADVDFTSLGIPSEAEYINRYCGRAGRGEIRDWNFYLAFSLFRAAAIMQGVYARSLQHDATGMDASDVHALIKPVSQIALDLVG